MRSSPRPPYPVMTLPLRRDSKGVASTVATMFTLLVILLFLQITLVTAQVTHVDQDVILSIDSSGSMIWNDPSNLRISSAQEYVRNLIPPDRVASIDFDDTAAFTRANIGGPAHLLNYPPNAELMYVSPQADLSTIDSSGSKNWGAPIKIANEEFDADGQPAPPRNLY